MLNIALTGGIACGKSLVGHYLAKKGVPVCETDEIGHEVLDQDESVRDAVVGVFGEAVSEPDGRINRPALGRMVFSDARKRERLNALTHPAILKRTAEWVATQRRTHDDVVVIIPLLFEIGAEHDWDKVICVAAPLADQMKRLAARGLTADEARARIQAQMGLAMKMERADYVIYNCGDERLLEEQTQHLWRTIRGV